MHTIQLDTFNNDYVSLPKSLFKAPLSLAAKGLLIELLLNEGPSKQISEEQAVFLNELLTLGILTEQSNDNGVNYKVNLNASLPNSSQSMPSEPVSTVSLPIVDSVQLQSKDQDVQATVTFGQLYDCLSQLPLKTKLPQPNYHKLRAQLLHWQEKQITPEHVQQAYQWLLLEKGQSRFINWWDLDKQIWEVKALIDRQQERQSRPKQQVGKGVNGHLYGQQTASSFEDDLQQANQAIADIFQHWQSKTKMRGELTIDRVRVIRNALASFSIKDLKLAVEGALLNDYCVSRGMLSIADIYRNTDIIAKHIHKAQNPHASLAKQSPAEQAINIALNDLPEITIGAQQLPGNQGK